MFKSLPIRIRNSFTTPIKEKIFFLHVPKCGGNSIKDSLKRNYLSLGCKQERTFIYIQSTAENRVARMLGEEESTEFSVPFDCVLRVPEYLLLYHMNQSHVRCIVGHVPFSEIAYRNFSHQYAFITILRDPVERWISEYFYNRSHSRANANMTMEDYLESPYGSAQGTQYVLYLGGRSNRNDHESRQAVQRALRNIDRFAVIGFLEDLSLFEQQFRHRFGVRVDIGRKNVTAFNPSREQITPEMRKKIENICERDCEIYEQARQRFS